MTKWLLGAAALAVLLLTGGTAQAQQVVPGTSVNGITYSSVDMSNLAAPVPVIGRPVGQQASILQRLYYAMLSIVPFVPNRTAPITPSMTRSANPAQSTTGSLLPNIPPLVSGSVH